MNGPGIKQRLATLVLGCCAIAALLAAPASAKQTSAGRLDPSFGKGGKATVAFPAENAGEIGIKYTLPFDFTPGHLEMAAAPGGRIVVAGSTKIVEFLPNGKLNRGFGGDGSVSIERPAGQVFVLADAAVDSQGRVVVAGTARPQPAASTPDPLISSAMVMRFAADGSVDTSFGNGGVLLTDFGIKAPEIGSGRYIGASVGVRSLAIDAQDRPLLTGGSVAKIANCYSTQTAVSVAYLARLTVSGAPDPSFGGAGLRQVPDFAFFEQLSLSQFGTLLTVDAGQTSCASTGSKAVATLTSFGPEGVLDPNFGFAGFRQIGFSRIPVITIAPSGKIVLLGTKGKARQLMRLLPNGGADPSFGRTGRVNLVLPKGAGISSVAVDDRGRLLLAGHSSKRVSKKAKNPLRRSSFLLARMNPEGNVDRSFGRKGTVRTGFGGPSSSSATQVMVDSRGRIVVGGSVATPQLGTGGGFAIARYLSGDVKRGGR